MARQSAHSSRLSPGPRNLHSVSRTRSGHLLAVGAAALLCALGAGVSPARADSAPCEFWFTQGEVVFASPLAVEAPLSEASKACLAAVAGKIGARTSIRSVTVAARLPAAQRVGGTGLAIAQSAAEVLVDNGLQKWQVSAVAPASHPDEPAALRIAFRERRATRPVARLQAVSGEVDAGSAVADLERVARGAVLVSNQLVRTGPHSYARLLLADGSLVRLGAGGLLRLGAIEISKDLERNVKLVLYRGTIQTIVQGRGMRGRFNVLTRTAVAGVRGTDFRTTSDGKHATRIETLGGTVELASKLDSVTVGAGRGSRVGRDGLTEQTRALLAAPTVKKLRHGRATARSRMRWASVPAAASYLIEIARDAEFSLEVSERVVQATEARVGQDLGAGKWFWRVTSVDPDGFVGLPSKIYSFVLDQK